LVLAAALRLPAIGDYWFISDEGIHIDAAFQPTWSQMVDKVFAQAHPPLLYLVVRLWGAVSREPGWLRLPLALAGLLAVAAIFCWHDTIIGRAGAVAGAVLLAIAPGAVVLSQVIRHYALLLLFETATFWFLARYLSARRGLDLAAYGTALLLAIASHYSACILLAPLAAVWIWRATQEKWDRPDIRNAVVAHIPALLSAAFVMACHVRHHLGDGELHQMVMGYLGGQVISRPYDLLRLVVRAAAYPFGEIMLIALIPWMAGGLWILWRRRWIDGLLLVGGTVAAASGLSAAGLYPLGSSRHSVHLLPLFILPAACAVQAAWDAGRRRLCYLALASLLVPACPHGLGLQPLRGAPQSAWSAERALSRPEFERLRSALDAIGRPANVLFMDRETFTTLLPYLNLDVPPRSKWPAGRSEFRTWRGATVGLDRGWRWEPFFDGDDSGGVARLQRMLRQALDRSRVPPGRIFLVHAGCPVPLLGILRRTLPGGDAQDAFRRIFRSPSAELVEIDARYLRRVRDAAADTP
jgi:hypothetical protein